jgi:peptidoglycan hydrolase-like protein with peptidoglycan-binding domain
MTDTLWADVSEFNAPVDDAYPFGFFSLRSNDGFHLDIHYVANYGWAKAARKAGRLWGFIVYYFYRPGIDGAAILRGRVGTPDPRLVVMIDVESDRGNVSGDQSAQINREFAELATWLGNPHRVIGYGNTGDLDALWPSKPPGVRLVVAAYGSNPPYPGKFAHQFSDAYTVPPFGPCDINSADGMGAADLEAMFEFATPPPPPPPSVRWEVQLVQSLPTLAQGATGPDVRRVQALCGADGHPIAVDGQFGPNTKAAVEAVQRAAAITVDGVVGQHTWAALLGRNL